MAKAKQIVKIDEGICCGCSLCVVNCPFGCLTISAPKKRGDIHTYAVVEHAEKCVGCGICAKECPIDAMEMVAVIG